MPIDALLLDLISRVGAFHITQRSMKRAQNSIETAIRNGAVDDAARAEYLREVRRYFEGFEREARAHLRDVDRRLEHVNQVHFNLTAERGVAVKRIEGTQAVLHALAAIEDPAT
ncbi:MAG TPA: hypothetical protein VFF63_01870 [Candidatus Babeliales bacterium]|nr:hypothetical protein [Candidatus Babeliales bacterium]